MLCVGSNFRKVGNNNQMSKSGHENMLQNLHYNLFGPEEELSRKIPLPAQREFQLFISEYFAGSNPCLPKNIFRFLSPWHISRGRLSVSPFDAATQIFKEIIEDAGLGYCWGQICNWFSASHLRSFTAFSTFSASYGFS